MLDKWWERRPKKMSRQFSKRLEMHCKGLWMLEDFLVLCNPIWSGEVVMNCWRLYWFKIFLNCFSFPESWMQKWDMWISRNIAMKSSAWAGNQTSGHGVCLLVGNICLTAFILGNSIFIDKGCLLVNKTIIFMNCKLISWQDKDKIDCADCFVDWFNSIVKKHNLTIFTFESLCMFRPHNYLESALEYQQQWWPYILKN